MSYFLIIHVLYKHSSFSTNLIFPYNRRTWRQDEVAEKLWASPRDSKKYLLASDHRTGSQAVHSRVS